MMRLPVLVILSGALAAAWPARAIVGGAHGPHPLEGAAAMVLNSRGGMCSAVVLGPRAVLTAAHCVGRGDAIRVHWRNGAEPVLVEQDAVAVHPGYDAAAVAKRRPSVDLALVRVPSPLPARFTAATLAAATPRSGAPVVAGGWGVLRENDPRSTGTFRTATLAVIEPYGPSRSLLWMSGEAGRAVGPCTGDSGGPIADGSGDVVATITWSTGAGGASCGARSQGVLLGPSRSWIDGTLAGWGLSPPRWRSVAGR